ncbi:hypothetical protein IFR05_015984 [Cadophora sp. M221]|nr:hypothetical protein IFR05_015984 [Cadophora sp. M221]
MLQFMSGSSSAAEKSKTTSATRNFMSCLNCRQRRLKCDRVKPACSTCTKSSHTCEYPTRKRNPSLKRRSYKQLETRLLELESQSGKIGPGPSLNPTYPAISTGSERQGTGIWSEKQSVEVSKSPVDLPGNEENSSLGIGGGFDVPSPSLLAESPAEDLVRLGLHEGLPSKLMQHELFQIYFDKIHHQAPFLHKYRLLAAFELGLNLRPPTGFLYSMWAIAASVSSKYEHLAEVFYQRARWYAEAAEMKGRGEDFITIYMAQCWFLIGKYETSRTYFTRAWMSTGRYVRLVQIMNLSSLDKDEPPAVQILKLAEDVIEKEIRRRTFWMAFCNDRWASAGTGWPIAISESDIYTNLPCSEFAFESGQLEETLTLHEALQFGNISKLSSSFAGLIVASVVFGRNYTHIHPKVQNDHPEDFTNGQFWRRHREMDNTLSNILLRLPDSLKLPRGLNNMEVVFLNLTFHASSISLHQAAILTAEKYDMGPRIRTQSLRRCLVSADQIANTVRLVSHQDSGHMDSILGYCLYIAGIVYIYDLKQSQPPSPHSSSNLNFLLASLHAIRTFLPIMSHFSAQLELDLDAAGLAISPIRMDSSTSLTTGLTFLDANSEASAAYIGISNVADIRNGRLKVLSPVSGIVLRGWTEVAIRGNTMPLSKNTAGGHATESSSTSLSLTSHSLVSEPCGSQVNMPDQLRSSHPEPTLSAALSGIWDLSSFNNLQQNLVFSAPLRPENTFDITNQDARNGHHIQSEPRENSTADQQNFAHGMEGPGFNETRSSLTEGIMGVLDLNNWNAQEFESLDSLKFYWNLPLRDDQRGANENGTEGSKF